VKECSSGPRTSCLSLAVSGLFQPPVGDSAERAREEDRQEDREEDRLEERMEMS
jgi:hypothetical protein